MPLKIKVIEDKLIEFRNSGLLFGPEQLVINEVSKSHNGFGGVMTSQDGSGVFYNGVRCAFTSFSVLFITHEGTVDYRPGILQVIMEQFPLPGSEFAYMSPQNVLATASDLLTHMPNEVGFIYNPIKPSISLTREQWHTIENGKDGERLVAALTNLIEAAKLGYMLILLNEHGNSDGFLSFDPNKKYLRIFS